MELDSKADLLLEQTHEWLKNTEEADHKVLCAAREWMRVQARSMLLGIPIDGEKWDRACMNLRRAVLDADDASAIPCPEWPPNETAR